MGASSGEGYFRGANPILDGPQARDIACQRVIRARILAYLHLPGWWLFVMMVHYSLFIVHCSLFIVRLRTREEPGASRSGNRWRWRMICEKQKQAALGAGYEIFAWSRASTSPGHSVCRVDRRALLVDPLDVPPGRGLRLKTAFWRKSRQRAWS
ncbi:hypothetical protein CIHG_09453 [Coccidioides immitis H538.4]|uniref:Uncharacterized protein n=1 Tax=Coccidioides immitis H538.4 TaxID=396776 RepID=A0A0J8UUU4_COCIT|nr:hypothetical protein CIHG_09453 [Coccidioides immitis H538.4]